MTTNGQQVPDLGQVHTNTAGLNVLTDIKLNPNLEVSIYKRMIYTIRIAYI